MLVVETVGWIRRAYFVQHGTIKAIARELKLSRNTVRKVIRSGETAFSYSRDVQPRPKLGSWATELERLLAENEARPKRERLDLEHFPCGSNRFGDSETGASCDP